MLPLHNHIQNDPVSKNKEYVICKNLFQKAQVRISVYEYLKLFTIICLANCQGIHRCLAK